MSGRSLPQLTRLIRQYRQSGHIRVQAYQRRGPATKHILEREFAVFGKTEFQRLAKISVSHLYNLRRSRRRPDPQGRPGYLRVDTVHQGDWNGTKGVYHLNAVDAVTQWEVVGCTARISEHFLKPVLEAMLHQFPFPILGFHADNGSEFINHTVARLLNKLLAEFTKSRPCRSLDNALVEGKNGAIIRKHMGCGHIPAQFYRKHFNPYLNCHRPCGFAQVLIDPRGKRKRIYRPKDYRTPYEKLKSLPQAAQYLKSDFDFQQLDRVAGAMSDTECARRMEATGSLTGLIRNQRRVATRESAAKVGPFPQTPRPNFCSANWKEGGSNAAPILGLENAG
jgi:transposase InsO family protein